MCPSVKSIKIPAALCPEIRNPTVAHLSLQPLHLCHHPFSAFLRLFLTVEKRALFAEFTARTLTRLWMHLLWRDLRTSPSGRRLSPGRGSFPWRPSLTQNTVSSEGEEIRSEMDETRERHAAGEDLDLFPGAPNMEARGSTQDLREIRRMVEFLLRREKKLT